MVQEKMYMDVDDVCAILGVSKAHAYNLMWTCVFWFGRNTRKCSREKRKYRDRNRRICGKRAGKAHKYTEVWKTNCNNTEYNYTEFNENNLINIYLNKRKKGKIGYKREMSIDS